MHARAMKSLGVGTGNRFKGLCYLRPSLFCMLCSQCLLGIRGEDLFGCHWEVVKDNFLS